MSSVTAHALKAAAHLTVLHPLAVLETQLAVVQHTLEPDAASNLPVVVHA